MTGDTNKKISEIVSTPLRPFTEETVRAALDRAAQKKWLNPRPTLLRHNIPAENMDQIEARFVFQPRLAERLNRRPLREVRVVMAHGRKEFGYQAAMYVASYIRRARICGVAWGQDVASVVSGMEDIWDSSLPASVEFFPVRGEPLGRGPVLESPTYLCRVLGGFVNGRGAPGPPSLLGIPALIPLFRKDDSRKFKAAKRAFMEFPAFERIFSRDGLLARADTVLLSVGSAGVTGALSSWTQSCLAGLCKPGKWPDAGRINGDIAGIALRRPDFASDKTLDAVDERWLGLSRGDLLRVAKGDPGVILCAYDPSKSDAVLNACRNELVSQLVVSAALAKEMATALGV